MSVFLIAEAGSNWYAGPDEADLNRKMRAAALVKAAADAGADAVKFQAFRADDLYPKDSEHWHTVKPLELPLEWLPILGREAEKYGIEFMCSTFSEEMVDAVDPYVKRHKVASLEITDLSLLRHIASKGKPVIVSTGASDWATVRDAIVALRSSSGIHLLHCVTSYPCDPGDANMLMVRTLRGYLDSQSNRRYSLFKKMIQCGLSDHTLDPIVAPVMAVALGATVIEKHFTLSRSLHGPDHAYALEPHELKQMVDAVRLAERMLGDGQKRIQPSEEPWRQWQHKDGGLRGEA